MELENIIRSVLEGECCCRCMDDQDDVDATVKALAKALTVEGGKRQAKFYNSVRHTFEAAKEDAGIITTEESDSKRFGGWSFIP